MLWWIVALGAVAALMTFKKTLPPSRELVIKLGTLMNMAERADGARYAEQLAPITPFVGKRFVHSRIKGVLRADLSPFGPVLQQLQREARRLDVQAHLGMIPVGLYLIGVGLWFALR